MLVDGRAIAAQIVARVAKEAAALPVGKTPRLAIITCAPNFETTKYLALKQRKAATAGIVLEVIEIEASATTGEVVAAINKIIATVNAVVVQLPLPAHVDREAVLQAVPVTHDPDGFCYATDARSCLPPVVAAVLEIASSYDIPFLSKSVVIMGQGRLVGAPMRHYFTSLGVNPIVLTEASTNTGEVLLGADVIITGIGRPGFVTSDMVKEGVCIFDAGTSEDGGVLVGDVAPAVAEKASFFTPVPGGIGPITVAALLANVMKLASAQWRLEA